MKKLATAAMVALVLSTVVTGCAKKGDTKDDAEVTEGSREITPAASGGMQRMEEEEAVADDPAPAVDEEPAPE